MEGELHKKIKNQAANYIMNKGYRLARLEKTVPCGIADAWGIRLGYNQESGRCNDTILIEVKTSRSDFLSDKCKLSLLDCSVSAEEVYYACPKGLIKPEELPEYIGLLYFYEDSNVFRRLRKAKYRTMKLDSKIIVLCDFLYHKYSLKEGVLPIDKPYHIPVEETRQQTLI